MKVFEFVDGKLGKQVGDLPVIGWTGTYATLDGKFLILKNPKLKGHKSNFCLHESAGRRDTEYKPEDFGVDAIAFCRGQITSGYDAGTWDWIVLAKDHVIKEMFDKGMLVFKEEDNT